MRSEGLNTAEIKLFQFKGESLWSYFTKARGARLGLLRLGEVKTSNESGIVSAQSLHHDTRPAPASV
jgi:hypothetical protein